MNDVISIVVPCYNEEVALMLFMKELKSTMESVECDFEIILVDDESKDDTLRIIKCCANEDKRVKYISFSRNFGKEAAIYAGFEYASGDYVVMMDTDMQDLLRLLPEMYKIVKEDGYDSVTTSIISF